MVDAYKLRLSATEYAEAEYQLSKLVAKEVPVDEDERFLFFADVERCEETARAASATAELISQLTPATQSSCKDLDEGIAFTGASRTTDGPDQAEQTATAEDAIADPLDTLNNAGQKTTQDTAEDAARLPGASNQVGDTHGVSIRGPLLSTGHLRKLVRIQGKTIESSVDRVDRKLRKLTGLINSHHEMTKALPEAHDDIKQMLSRQVDCVGKLHAKLSHVAQVLGGRKDEPSEDEGADDDDDDDDDEGQGAGQSESD